MKDLKVLFWTYLCKDFLLCTVNCWVTRIFQSRQDTPTLHFQGKQYLNQCGMVGWAAPASGDKRNSIMFKWKMCDGRSAFSRKWMHWNKNSFAYEIKKNIQSFKEKNTLTSITWLIQMWRAGLWVITFFFSQIPFYNLVCLT